jgi:hypothetical protein
MGILARTARHGTARHGTARHSHFAHLTTGFTLFAVAREREPL